MRNLIITLLIVLVLAVIFLGPAALQFRESLGAVPPGVRLAGFEFGSADAPAVATALDKAFSEPVAVYYAGQRIILRPQIVGFKVDVPAMLAEAQKYNTAGQLALVFLGDMLNHPPRPIDVPLRYTLNRDALDNWLADIAGRYDRAPLPPQPVLDSLVIAPGQPGWKLDAAASRDRVITVLADPKARRADLAVREAAPPPIDMQALGELLKARLDEFPGTAGLFLHDITTGEEVQVDADVAYSGMSTMKIAIVEETYRKLNAPPNAEISKLISETMSVSSNESADKLIQFIGDGNVQKGLNVLNESMRTLGLKSTFMAAPYKGATAASPRIRTAANSRADLNTDPDPYVQTTPRDMGVLLEMLVECSQGQGALLAAYAGQLTQAECRQELDYMALNEMHELITAGVPKGTRVIHKHGYSEESHGDNAVVWGPKGPYVLSIYLHRPGEWLEWTLSSGTMKELSQAAWNYYAGVTAPSSTAPSSTAPSSSGSSPADG